jgi:transcriptional regulator with XRE-family HTH domain
MSSVGEKLKRARIEQGLDLSSVSERTKITASYLKAIESDDRKKLPSGFFYKSFVDQYARALSLDTREIDAEVDRLIAEDAPLPLPGQDENPVHHRVPPIRIRSRFHRVRLFASFTALVLVVSGCSGIYEWWREGRLPIDLSWLGVLERSIPGSDVIPAPEPFAATAAPAPSGATTAASPKVLLDLVAKEATWLSVSSDGRPVFSGVMSANETKKIEGKASAKLKVGNAAGLEVRLNGKPLGRLGERGQTLVVLFTPDNFEIASPAKESD